MYIEIEDDLYNGFDDDLKAKLKPYQPEDITPLKNKANELLGELKAAQAELAQKDAEVKTLKVKPPESKAGDLQAKLDDLMARYEQTEKEKGELVSSIQRGKVQSEAFKLASSLTADSAKAQLLAEKIGGRLKYDNDSLTVLSSNGQPTVSKPEELLSEFKTAYPFLVDGRQSTGGAATGNTGGAGNTKQVTRAEFDSMPQAQRAAFAKDGGRVSDS